MMFKDKNGTELYIGDYIIPDDGMELLLISQAYVPDFGEDCLFGQQILNPCAFSILTQENLSIRWTKADPPTDTYIATNLKSGTVDEDAGEKYIYEEPHDEAISKTKTDNIDNVDSDTRKVGTDE